MDGAGNIHKLQKLALVAGEQFSAINAYGIAFKPCGDRGVFTHIQNTLPVSTRKKLIRANSGQGNESKWLFG